MKKLLILFILAFPLLIFAIVNLSSTIISYFVPLAVSGVKMTEGEDIETYELNQTFDFKFQILPLKARNKSFIVVDDEGFVIVSYDQEKEQLTINNGVDRIVSFESLENEIKDDEIHFKIKIQNYGFTRLSVITVDGKYEAYSDIFVSSSSDIKPEVLGVVFDYRDIHSDYKFGDQNKVNLGFTYFPKRAPKELSQEEQDVFNEQLRENAQNLGFDITNNATYISNTVVENGRGLLDVQLEVGKVTITTTNLSKNSSYTFNVFSGVNIYNENELRSNRNNQNLFILKEIELTEPIVMRNIKVYGNDFKINHSKLALYTPNKDGQLPSHGALAIEINGNNSGFYNVHILGPLNSIGQPYENVINLGIVAKDDNDRYFEIMDCIIENGRFNLSVIGKAHSTNKREDKATVFTIKNVTLVGAYMASLEIDNSLEIGNRLNSTLVNATNLNIKYTAIGVILQNSKGGSNTQRGYGVLNLISDDQNPAIKSDSWRNLDDASGALNANNFGYILAELKTYRDVIYYDEEFEYFYVNPLIMIRGGTTNFSEVIFDDASDVFAKVILKERIPNLVESLHPQIGGTHPFLIYLVDPIYYQERLDES